MTHDEGGQIRVLFELTLANTAALWDAAALEATDVHAMTDDQIVETLGPREDPDAAACAAMLFDTVACRSGAIDATTVTVVRLEETPVRSGDRQPTYRNRISRAG